MTLPDGTRKYYRGATRKEAETKRLKDQMLQVSGVNLADDSTYKTVVEAWFKLTKEDKAKLHTRTKETTRGIMDRYVLPALGDKKTKAIRPVDIMVLMNSIGDMSKSTQSKVLQVLKGSFTFAVDNGIIAKSPVISSIKAEGDEPEEVEPLTDEQCSKLLVAVKGTRAYLFVMVLLFAGLRKGEAIGLRWADLDFDRKIIHVRRSVVYPANNKRGELNEDLKTKSAKRDIPMVPELKYAFMEARRNATSIYVFPSGDGGFMSESSFRRMWDIISYRKIDPEVKDILHQRTLDFDVHPHMLRHTCITRWIEAGLDVPTVQRLAGHKNPEVTLRIYTHYRESQRADETAEMMTISSGRIAIPV